ncbi:sensor histidine kinase [Myroides injenensis]|uniref:sensor histidine kinase n=1 Tax=Myroides injenensis TaxID=1183151 RepID=UPI00028827C1|nr:histidine kinase [Myroides injenensis]
MAVKWRRHIILACSIGVLTGLAISYYSFQDSGMSFLELMISSVFLKNTFFSFVLSVLIYAANLFSTLLMEGILDKLNVRYELSLSKLSKNAIFFINGVVTSAISYYLFLSILLNWFYNISYATFFNGDYMRLGNFIAIVMISVFVLLIVFLFGYNDRLRLLEIKNKEMEIALQRSQIESMKEQLSPHFLFNNMNVLISTIQEDPIKAERFARSFSKIYRYVLEKLDYTMCSVLDELTFIKDYVYLLNVRYDNAIDFEIADEVYNYLEEQIPPLSLQVLIENVIKHNIIPSEGKIKVVLEIQNDGLLLWNEKRIKSRKEFSSKVGLKNLSQRYSLLFHQDIIINDLENSFSVNIPFNRKDR